MKIAEALGESDRNTILKLYQDFERDDGYLDAKSHNQNLEYLRRISRFAEVPFANSTVLDVGCGTGKLLDELAPDGIKDYLGIDIYTPALTKAILRHPDRQFEKRDILAQPLFGIYDFGVCAGPLSNRLSQQDNYRFSANMIQTIWNATRVGLVFYYPVRLHPSEYHPDFFFYDPVQMRDICEQLPDVGKIVEEDRFSRSRYTYLIRENNV